jgi:hypothetical protein
VKRYWLLAGLAVCLFSAALPVVAEPVPPQARGIWAEGGCEAGNTHYLLNSGFVMAFLPVDGQAQLIYGPVEWAAGAPLLQRPEGMMLLPPVAMLQRCQALPASYYAWFGESIALFQAYDEALQRCQGSTVERCAGVIFGVLDITRDGRLSVAEISRGLRGIGPLLAYEVIVAGRKDTGDLARLAVGTSDLFGGSVIASVTGRFVVDGVLRTYDFDGDGFLSLSEILQDRGPVSVTGVTASVSIAASHAALTSLLQNLPTLAGIFGPGLLGGILR